MKNTNKNYIRAGFYLLWLGISLAQALLTPLLDDEAYYWMFSTQPAWGYFEHPPMVAFFIRTGYAIFSDPLGVRLMSVLAVVVSIYLLEQIVKPKRTLLFFALISSVAILQAIGFLAIPDAPLLLFSAVFFLGYQRYLTSQTWYYAVLLGIAGGLMILSKYHGILVIGFTILSNLKLLRKGTFWLAAAVALGVLTPHINWLILNDFPTLRFHLLDRSPEPYLVRFTLLYLVSVLFVFGPLAGPLLLWSGLAIKPSDHFHKALKWNILGILTFFLTMSLKGPVEIYWLMAILIPSLVLGYSYMEEHRLFRKTLQILILPSLLLILAARLLIAMPYTPEQQWLKYIKKPFKGPGEWVSALSETAQNRPVIFMNSYQNASVYAFYAQKPSMSLSNIMGRKNQFDLWTFEEDFRGREVLIISNYLLPQVQYIPAGKDSIPYLIDSSFQVQPKIYLQPENFPREAAGNDTLSLSITAMISDQYKNTLGTNPEDASMIMYKFFRDIKPMQDNLTGIQLTSAMLNTSFPITIITPSEPGTYTLLISLQTGWLPPTINSKRIPLKIH